MFDHLWHMYPILFVSLEYKKPTTRLVIDLFLVFEYCVFSLVKSLNFEIVKSTWLNDYYGIKSIHYRIRSIYYKIHYMCDRSEDRVKFKNTTFW